MINYKIPQVQVRLVKEGRKLKSSVPFDNPETVYCTIAKKLSEFDRETLLLVCLDKALIPINYSFVALGSIDKCVVFLPNIFKTAILSNSTGIIIAHNHPSGNLTPSDEDLQVTSRIIEAGKLMEIPLIDHIICGNNEYQSLKENYTWLFE